VSLSEQPENASAKQLWERLTAEMKAARERSGWQLQPWARERGLNYARSHLSNLEHGRGRPPRELVQAYDEDFSPRTDKTHLQRLRDVAEEAEQREQRERRAEKIRKRGIAVPPTPDLDPIAAPGAPEQEERADPPADQPSPPSGRQADDGAPAQEEQADSEGAAPPGAEQSSHADRARPPARPRITVTGGAVVAVGALALGGALVVLALAAALSGGRDQPEVPSLGTGGPSTQDFAKRAIEICADTQPRIDEAGHPIEELVRRAAAGDESAEQAFGQQLDKLGGVLQERRQQLRELDAPKGEAGGTPREFVRADSSLQYGTLAALGDARDALKTGKREDLVEVLQRLELHKVSSSRDRVRRDALAAELGASECGA